MPTSALEAIEISAQLWPVAFGHSPRRKPPAERLPLPEHLQAVRERFGLPTVWSTYGSSGGVISRRHLIRDEIERVREALRLQPHE